MNIEKFNKEFKNFIKEASDYLTDNVLNYSCDQKLVNTATNDLDILLDRFLEKIGVNYPIDFSIKCEIDPEYYSRYDCCGNEYKELTTNNTIKVSFYYKDELIQTTNDFYAYAFPIIDAFDISIKCD